MATLSKNIFKIRIRLQTFVYSKLQNNFNDYTFLTFLATDKLRYYNSHTIE